MKGQNISNYNINLNISPEKGVINVESDINVKFIKDRRYIIFLLNDGLKIDSIGYKKAVSNQPSAISHYRIWLINFLLLPEKIKKDDDENSGNDE